MEHRYYGYEKRDNFEQTNDTISVRIPTELNQILLGDFIEDMFKLLHSNGKVNSIVAYIKKANFTIISAQYAEAALQILDRTANYNSIGTLDWDSIIPLIEEDGITDYRYPRDLIMDRPVNTDLVPYGVMEEFTVLSQRLSRKSLYRVLVHVIKYSDIKENSHAS